MLALIDGDSFISAAAWGRDEKSAREHVLRQITWVIETTFATDYLIAVGDPNGTNFRSTIYPLYKKSASRESSRKSRPEWFGGLTQLLIEQPNVVVSVGCEADDLVRMWSVEADAAGDPRVVSSIDKDLDCIPGQHHNSKTGELYVISEDSANAFYWQQILQGDGVDNIPGLPGIGPVKARKMLEGLKTHEERKDRVVNAYMDVYGTQWQNYLIANGRLIHMWRFEKDYFDWNNND